jgi:flagellar biosynthesis protein FliP
MGSLPLASAFLVTIAVLLLALRAMAMLSERAGRARAPLPFALLHRVALTQRQGVALVRVGERVHLLSWGEGGVRLLRELEAEEARVAVGEAERPVASAAAKRFRALLERVRPASRAALVLLALGAGALAGIAALPAAAVAQGADLLPPAFDLAVGGSDGLQISGPVGIVLVMGMLSLLPMLLLLMTSFTRLIVVLHLFRQAIGTQTAPPTMLLGAIALLLTGFIMAPVLEEANRTAIAPYLAGDITQTEAFTTGIEPFRAFMLRQTREEDLALFVDLSGAEAMPDNVEEVGTIVLMSAFVLSELRTAFLIGFKIFLPFIVIDLIVACVLLGLGVFMLPPALVSLPFKLLMIVLADGWFLLVSSLVAGYRG